MPRNDDDYDGVQYDTFYAPDPLQIEAEQIRRKIAESERASKRDNVLIIRPR